jgi:DNA-binding Xre family transcriptional regulator
MKQIKWRFAAVMVDAGLSREDVAKAMGVSVSSISRYRKAAMPQIDGPTLANMCSALGCVPADLVQLVEVPDAL